MVHHAGNNLFAGSFDGGRCAGIQKLPRRRGYPVLAFVCQLQIVIDQAAFNECLYVVSPGAWSAEP
jgi:hypothetical protein